MKNAERTGTNHYVELMPTIKNPKFNNENPYGNMKYPDAGYRLLALYRYWNIIQYYFPYKNLIEEDWKEVLREFIPVFVNAGNETEYIVSALEIIGRIHDTHANIYSYSDALEGFKGRLIAAPAITFVEGQAVVTGLPEITPAQRYSIKIGDVITSVNGQKVEDIVAQRLRITPASNYATQLREIASDLLRSNEPEITITYLNRGREHQATLPTYDLMTISQNNNTPRSNVAFKVLPHNIGYLYPGMLKRGEIERLWESIKETQGLIIDLRCYPSDFIVFSLGNKLLNKTVPFAMFSKGDTTTPGLFTITPPIYIGRSNPSYYKGNVAILVNETTVSQAEYTTMAFRTSPNVTVIGSTTAGADGNISEIILPGAVRTMISGIGVYNPDGSETQRIGIIPDIEIKPTIAGIRAGRDEVLEKAIKVVR